MCGIYGKLYSNDLKKSLFEVNEMINQSIYRGPDSQKVYQTNHHTFGFSRLSIIDLDDRSNQPFIINEINKLIVFNGEIYNYLEIKKDLISLGYTFSTESDTEVALIAFHHFGPDVFNLFNGMWALCIYDISSDLIYFSRDRLGVKPLYYMFQEGSFYFASEIKSLLKVKNEIKFNNDAELQYLILGNTRFKNNETLILDINEHPAGCYSTLQNKNLKVRSYYQIPNVLSQLNKSEFRNKILDVFTNAIKLRLRSDVPVAILLSAGLDSSAIVYQINDMIANGELKINKIYAFTLKFENYVDCEWDMVKNNAHLIPFVNIEPIEINLEKFSNEIKDLMRMQDIPSLSISHLIHFEALRIIKKKDFKVVINGQGADELFGGYFPKDIGFLLLDILEKSFTHFLHELKMLKRCWKFTYTTLVYQIIKAWVMLIPSLFFRIKFKRISVNKKLINSNIYSIKSQKSYHSFSTRHQIFDTGFNGILQYEDMASMYNSLEMRSPFLDYRLVNMGLECPASLKLREGNSKWILRYCFEGILPKNICWANWKLGYSVPKQILASKINLKGKSKNIDNDKEWRKFNLDFYKSNVFAEFI